MIQGYNTNYSLSLIMTLSIINGLQGDMMEVAKVTMRWNVFCNAYIFKISLVPFVFYTLGLLLLNWFITANSTRFSPAYHKNCALMLQNNERKAETLYVSSSFQVNCHNLVWWKFWLLNTIGKQSQDIWPIWIYCWVSSVERSVESWNFQCTRVWGYCRKPKEI